ncbi:MAG: hypothetical protein PHI55_04610 [Burkholderiaceae bacterium]|nr:hypothetical protein [Burkholderiaceae bacterium]
MSDTSPFGFGKFVPGFDFLQNLAKGASSSMPQMPSLSSWVAPTISVEELQKRIDELKAVQFWLDQNSRALAATLQALEVQKMTLATLKGMNFSMTDLASAFTPKSADSVLDSVQKATASMAQAASAATQTAARAAADKPAPEAPRAEASQAAKGEGAEKAAGAASLVDPLQWWGALTSQFQQIAANAMNDAAAQAALDSTKSMATGLAEEAIKTATQLAAQGVQSMQDATRMASDAAAGGAHVAAKKPAAKAVAPQEPSEAAEPVVKKTPVRRAPRKPAA